MCQRIFHFWAVQQPEEAAINKPPIHIANNFVLASSHPEMAHFRFYNFDDEEI